MNDPKDPLSNPLAKSEFIQDLCRVLSPMLDRLADKFVQRVSRANRAPAKLLFNTKEAATMTNLPETWLAAKARAGEIPHHRIGHYRLFSRQDLDQILAQSAVPSKKP